MDSSPAIKAEALTRYYGDLLAVDHINFEVQLGEIFGFLGPNGAGKTTTVRMLTALLEPSEGTALLNGYDVSRQAYQAKRQMGLVPEESNVYDELSAWDNLIFAAKLYRVPRGERERRGRELLELLGLQEKRDVKIRFFSKGMRRRLSTATFSALGLLFASAPGQTVGSILMPSVLLRWPLLFISGVFIPLEEMSAWARVLSYLSPLTYTQDLMNHAVLGAGAQSLVLNLVVLPLCLVLSLFPALKLHDRSRKMGV